MQHSTTPILLASSQVVTTGWADFGPVIPCDGYDKLTLFNEIDVNSSVNIRQRILARLTVDPSTGVTEYVLPIQTITSSSILIEGQYLEFNVDSDQNIVTQYNLDGLHFAQIQIGCSATGATGGTVTAYYNLEI